MKLTVTQKIPTPQSQMFHDVRFGDWFCHPDHGVCIKIDHGISWSVVNKERVGFEDVDRIHFVKVDVNYELVGPKE